MTANVDFAASFRMVPNDIWLAKIPEKGSDLVSFCVVKYLFLIINYSLLINFFLKLLFSDKFSTFHLRDQDLQLFRDSSYML
jgi:hypothetical protein